MIEPLLPGGCHCGRERTDDSRLPWAANGAYGGWGGHAYFDTAPGVDRTPVIFAHGNGRDACDWEDHAAVFLDRGYRGDELWAITFRQPTPTHVEMAEQLDAFVEQVRDYTGAAEVAVVAHSLSVTGTRFWMEARDRYDWVSTVVGLAGANHGTQIATLCSQFGLQHGAFRVSDFLRTDYDRYTDHPLAKLNAGDETPGDVDYYTIRGTEDRFFTANPESPALDGAEANVVLRTDHDGVRTHPETVELLIEWCAESVTRRGE